MPVERPRWEVVFTPKVLSDRKDGAIRMNKTLVLVLLAVFAPMAYADQGSFANSGGSAVASSGVAITSSVATPAGALTISCPAVGSGGCTGGSLNFLSNDGSTSLSASFTSGGAIEGCSGGGRGGHITCSYTLNGYFSGTLSVNGATQAINGVTNQAFLVGGSATGTTAYNSAYTPFYYSDSEQILRSDDLKGTNQITFGSQGSGVGQFYGAYGIALDTLGRIYVADTYNCRVVRMDDMNGSNWSTFGGTCGAATGQFYDPSGIAVDSAGRIYVMDTGNSRLIRMDDMAGTNWISFGTVGSGVNQFASYVWVSVDAADHIYVADTGNRRVVRMDDMTGTNWTELTQSQPVNGVSSSFQSPIAVALDAMGRIYVADNQSYAPVVIRVDDMTGTNWTSIYTSPSGSTGLNSISVDSTGAVFTGGGGARIIDSMAGVLTSSGNVGPIGTYYVFGVTPVPVTSPPPSAISLSPTTLSFSENVGSTSPAQPVTIFNFGGSPLDLSGFSASSGFGETNTCPTQLAAGSNCTVDVTFTPSAAGQVSGSLTVTDDSGNAGPAQAVTLTGLGTAPVASVTPTTLTFSSQGQGTTSAAKSVVLQNTGTGPMQVASVTATSPFSQTNSCASVAPGSSCTILVSFTPTAIGAASGTLTIVDNAGTQTVALTGTGTAQVTLSSSTLSLGTVAVGNTSAAKTVTLTNHGNVALNFSSILTSTGFAVASNTCGTGIAAGAKCTVGVTFTPTAIGGATGTLTFTDDALNSPQTVSLTGTGSVAVTLSSSTLSFGTVVVGNTSAAKTVTLTNHENVTLNFSSILTSTGFAVASNTCGTGIAAGASCSVGVTFTPTAIGAATGTLTFTDGAPNSPQAVSLTGTGSAQVTLSASTLNLGTVAVGSTSAAKTVTLTNHGNVILNFSSILTSVHFSVASNTCGTGIGAGANCTVGVKFSPTATGTVTGTLTFTDSAGNSPQIVSLTGTGK